MAEHLIAHSKFRLLATMNPGGDFGKKELSPALKNRFTEIWVPAFSNMDDLGKIVQERSPSFNLDFQTFFSPISLITRFEKYESRVISSPLLDFWQV